MASPLYQRGRDQRAQDAICAKFERDNAIKYDRSQILVSSGAKQTIYNCACFLDHGDEAVIFVFRRRIGCPTRIMVMLADGLPVMPFGVTRKDTRYPAPARRWHHPQDTP